MVDVEVLRNVTVKRSAEALQSISLLVRGGRYQEAWLLARDTELQLRTVAALTADEQMVQDADLFRRYQVTLGQYAPAAGAEPADPRVPQDDVRPNRSAGARRPMRRRRCPRLRSSRGKVRQKDCLENFCYRGRTFAMRP